MMHLLPSAKLWHRDFTSMATIYLIMETNYTNVFFCFSKQAFKKDSHIELFPPSMCDSLCFP